MFKDKKTLELLADANASLDANVIELKAFKDAEAGHTANAELLTTSQAELVTVKASLLELEASAIDAKQDLEKVSAELVTSKEAQAEFDDKVSKKVRAEVAAKGSAPAPETLDEQEQRTNLVAEYKKLPVGDPKREEFRKANSKLFK
jgi:hypothetical protein